VATGKHADCLRGYALERNRIGRCYDRTTSTIRPASSRSTGSSKRITRHHLRRPRIRAPPGDEHSGPSQAPCRSRQILDDLVHGQVGSERRLGAAPDEFGEVERRGDEGRAGGAEAVLDRCAVNQASRCMTHPGSGCSPGHWRRRGSAQAEHCRVSLETMRRLGKDRRWPGRERLP
jgi:hypothetical protein